VQGRQNQPPDLRRPDRNFRLAGKEEILTYPYAAVKLVNSLLPANAS
jgi:hypothetical protein